QSLYYHTRLKGLRSVWQSLHPDCCYNYSYYPVILESEEILLTTLEQLQYNQVIARRYFFPSLSSLPYVKNQPCPVSENIAARALCLPLYHTLAKEEQDMICRIILRVKNNKMK